MDKFKFQIIGIILCLVIGFVASSVYFNKTKDSEIDKLNKAHIKALVETQKNALDSIRHLQNIVLELDKKSKIDSSLIVHLKNTIKIDGVRTAHRREEATKYTPDEKVKFLLDRYSSTPK